jgi:hypothetical protein
VLGVGRFTAGSARLQQRNSALGADALRGKPLPPEQVAEWRERSKRLGTIRFARARRWPDRPWTPAEVKLLGTLPDQAVAQRVKRSRAMVQKERVKRGIPAHGPNGVRR